MSERNKEILIEYIEEVWNNGNVSVIAQFAHSDYHARGLRLDGTIDGFEGIRQNVLGTRDALVGFNISFKDIIAEGNKVASRIVITGTNAETGKNVTVDEIMIHEFVDGKIKRVWSIESEQKETFH
ncbi:MAG: ester cyclase [Candidatus Thorarchaeota archaeon]